MPKNWKTYNLGEICTIKYGKDHKKLAEGSIPCYGTGGIMRYVESSLSEEESVLIPRKGSLNNIYYLDEPFWTVDTLFWTQVNKELLFPRFFYYNLKTLDFASKDVGSAIPSLTTELLNKIEIELPPLPEQKAIASILSAIDDKIENNLTMNRTLEEMAMALYKHWFVDFGPFQHHEFIDSELGSIPKRVGGETDKRLLDKLFAGKTPSKKIAENFTHDGDGYPFLKIPDMHGKTFVPETTDRVSEIGHRSQSKKLIPSFSVNVSCIATVGLVTVNPMPSHTNQQINSVVPNRKDWVYYLYAAMIGLKERFLNEASGGSATLNMNTSTFSNIELLKPIDGVLAGFHIKIEPLFNQVLLNQNENQTLTQLRDTLLPKLISGEVRVKDAEQTLVNTL